MNGQTTITLDANNVKALIPSTPILFYDGANASFKVPKSGNVSSIFSSTPWIAGTSDTTLYLAAEMYRQNGTDFQSGPVSNTYTNLNKWNVVKITKADIESFKNDTSKWSNPPASFLSWPAHGDSANGQAINLAPFVNQGGDPTKYEPSFGDYPFIKGDACSYYIFNDDKTHSESNGTPMKIEIHRMVYEYADTSKSFLNNAVFVEYKVINRSSRTYSDGIFTVYSDFDLGQYSDDFIGTDSILQMVYCYNGTENDAPNGYGTNPPAEGMILLNQKLSSGMFNLNDTSMMGNTTTPTQMFSYMNARWRDFTHLTYGNIGYNGNTNSDFAFSGDPCKSSGWTEQSGGMTPGDRRGFGNISMPNLKPDDVFNVTFAYLYARGNNGAASSVCALQQEASSLVSYYNNFLTGINEKVNEPFTLQVFPNPSHGEFEIVSDKLIQQIELYSIDGKLVNTFTPTSRRFKIDGLTSGMYFLHIQTPQGARTMKISVQ